MKYVFVIDVDVPDGEEESVSHVIRAVDNLRAQVNVTDAYTAIKEARDQVLAVFSDPFDPANPQELIEEFSSAT